jgi:hypothetical protein
MVNKGFIFNIGLDRNTPGLEQVLFVTSQRFERRRNVRKLVRKITSVAGNEPHSGAVSPGQNAECVICFFASLKSVGHFFHSWPVSHQEIQ